MATHYFTTLATPTRMTAVTAVAFECEREHVRPAVQARREVARAADDALRLPPATRQGRSPRPEAGEPPKAPGAGGSPPARPSPASITARNATPNKREWRLFFHFRHFARKCVFVLCLRRCRRFWASSDDRLQTFGIDLTLGFFVWLWTLETMCVFVCCTILLFIWSWCKFFLNCNMSVYDTQFVCEWSMNCSMRH